MCKLLISGLFCLLIPLGSRAVLPVDAGFRQKEIKDMRQRKMAAFEQAHRQHETLIIYKDREIRQEMRTSPWGSSAHSSVLPGAVTSPLQQKSVQDVKRTQRWMFSLLSLLLIGGCVWWVRIATERESDR